MKREIIKIDEYGQLAIPVDSDKIWMTETELAELFGTMVPTLKIAIQTIYKSGIVRESETKQYIRLPNGNRADAYDFEMIVALAFRLNSHHAAIVRKWLQRKATTRNQASIPIIIGSKISRDIC
ncbi:MAG: hypothetical protein NC226_04690 [Bacteroides cellulosilyticus]|nr:hypothetical protein [Bacteroides cellulosilyticus]